MAPTSKEEIDRQHQVAIQIIEGYDGFPLKPCAPHNQLGEISLQDKTQPTYPFSFYNNDNDNDNDTDNGNDEKKIERESTDSDSDSESQQPMKSQPSLLNPICWSTRGQNVDISKLQNMVREGYDLNYMNYKADYDDENHNDNSNDDENNNTMPVLSPTNYWDPRNAANTNVTLSRPSHDAWGIGKIVLIFSDDFLTKVYQFPWWKEFEDAIQPILDVLFPPPGSNSKGLLVRALLASLPPGSTIPVHHDTGEWVKTTHRVHVPVLVQDPSKIVFQCGPATHLLQRINCEPGVLFEINNQAKHAVSNCDNDHRVHLILDYIVQDNDNDRNNNDNNNTAGKSSSSSSSPSEVSSPLIPIVLEPKEKLVQTRRSVDRLKDMVSRPTPSYIILGAQKAGTTSLYHYINEHPWVIKARRRETHCLDWRWDEKIKTKSKQLEYCQKFFFTDHVKNRVSCQTGDSSPSYLLDSRRVIPRLKRVFDWKMKFFVMMRDPVRRATSHYSMVTSTDGTPAQQKTRGLEWRNKSLWDVVQMEMKKMNECSLIPYWNIEDGIIDQDCFDQFFGSQQEDEAWNRYLERYVPLNTGSYGLLTRGMYAVQLRPWFRSFDRDQFMFLRLESMKSKNGVPNAMERVFSHLDLPYHPICDESAKNSREYESTDTKIHDYLQRFFEPHNRGLASVIQTKSEEWIDPWPYQVA